MVALPWLILQINSSAEVLGQIMMAEAIPRGLLMLLGGAVTDRRSPRMILMATASARAHLVAVLAAVVWTRQVQTWQLYTLAFLFGVADAFAAPAGQTLLLSVVQAEQLPAANSLSQITAQLAALIVPAPAGILVASLGVAWRFSIDAASFLFVILALWTLRDPRRPESATPPRNIGRSIVDGLRYVMSDVPLSSLLLVMAGVNFCLAGPMGVGLAFVAKSIVGSAVAFGLLMSSLAAGSLTGLALGALRQQRARGRLLRKRTDALSPLRRMR